MDGFPSFAEWLRERGCPYPDLKKNWPAGDAWGAAEFLGLAHRAYELQRDECERWLNEILSR